MFNYIDPSATSILITSIAAIAASLGAVFFIFFRKVKKGVKKTFHIDENAGKEVEDDLVINDEATEEAPAEENVLAAEEDNKETKE